MLKYASQRRSSSAREWVVPEDAFQDSAVQLRKSEHRLLGACWILRDQCRNRIEGVEQ